MSEEDNKPKPPAKPTTKTSTVPLKKETVRITLRAKPGAGTEAAGAPAPPAPPSPPKPPAPPAPSAGGAPRPPAPPAPPAPPRPGGGPPAPAPPKPGGGAPPAPAPTIPLTAAPPAGGPPAGAKTVPLTAAPAPSGPAVGAQTGKLQTPPAAAPGTRPLPKATVKLAATKPIASAPTGAIGSAPIKGGVASQVLADDEAEDETGIMPFAAIALVLAVAVLAIEIITSQRVVQQDKAGSPGFAVPQEVNRYHRKSPAGDWTPTFKAPQLPDYTPASSRTPDIGSAD